MKSRPQQLAYRTIAEPERAAGLRSRGGSAAILGGKTKPSGITKHKVVIFLFGALFSLFLLGCRFEDRFIFYPSAHIEHTPGHLQLAFDEVFFSSADGVQLYGWFIAHPQARSTLLWFHGNAGNISHRLENIRLLHDKVGINVFIFDYRGYGRSTGQTSEQGTYQDGAAALRYLLSRHDIDPARVVFFGRSLGAAVAAELAARNKCLALILETPFASIPRMAAAAFPWLPIAPLLHTRYDTLEKVRRVQSPLLVIHGDQDEIVPYSQAQEVFIAASAPKEFYTIRGARHNDTYIVGGDAYFATLKDFIERASAKR